jgi:glycine/D-amino acid oxidase-like deaminating enzyme
MNADVIIVGGGVVGSSIAYHLLNDHFAGRVIVFERDSTYARASSNLAMGGIRQQFGAAPNIRMAQYSVGFYRSFDETMSRRRLQPRAHFCQRGYLFLVNEQLSAQYEQRYEHQLAFGANVRRLTVEEISQLVSGILLDDIRFGLFGPEDGYLDPKAVLWGFRELAEAAGAEYRTGEVSSILRNGTGVTGVEIDGREHLRSSIVVNAAGAYAAAVAASAGVDIPVVPVRQQLFRCAIPKGEQHRLPVILDPGGVHWRYEDPAHPNAPAHIVVARTKWDEPPGDSVVPDFDRWWNELRPDLVRRMPRYANATLVDGWGGLYELTPDHNPVLGEHPLLRGFFLANGFSGHGLMLAPAVGKLLASLIQYGRWEFEADVFTNDRFSKGLLVHDNATV